MTTVASAFFLVGDDIHERASVDGFEALGGFVQNGQFRADHDRNPPLNLLLLATEELLQLQFGLVR